MKKLISDKELIDYISAKLSSEDTRILYERAKINGETDLLYHVQMASLAWPAMIGTSKGFHG